MAFIELANQSSTFRRELMKDDYVNVKFSAKDCTVYPKGTPLNGGAVYENQHYVLMEDYVPTYNNNTDSYDYDMTFKAWYYVLENKIFCDISAGDTPTYNSVEWTLTDKPSKFFDIIKTNVKLIDTNFDVDFDDSIDAAISFVTCTFNGTNILDAINQIVKALDPETNYYEWWFVGHTLYVGKLNKNAMTSNNGVVLTTGTNVGSVSVQKSSSKRITKLFAYSADRNISMRYGKTAPVITATTEVKDDDGNTVGYQDPNHIMSANMFRSGSRFYDNIASVENDQTTFTYKKSATTQRAAFPFLTNRNAYATGTYAIKFNATSLKVTFTNHDYTQPNSIGIGYEFEVSARFVEVDFVGNTTNVISTIFTKKAVNNEWHDEFEITLSELVVLVDKNKSYAIEFKATLLGYKQNGTRYNQDAPLNGVYASISKDAFKAVIQSQNYAINVGGSFGIWNPKYYPITNPLSRCFSKSATGMPDNAILGKLPYAWFSDNTSASDAVSQKRLSVVVGSGDVEGQMVFDNIYPSMGGTLSGTIGVTAVEEEDSSGQKTGRVLSYYTFLCAFLKDIDESDFTEEHATISFTDDTSPFYGKEFELKIMSTSSAGTVFAIIPNDNYGKLLPNDNSVPSGSYKIVGIDASYYEGSDIIAAAQQELASAASAYLTMVNIDQNVYSLKMLAAQGTVGSTQVFPEFGDAVYFSDKSLATRVIGVQHPLDIKQADYNITIGNSRTYKKIDNLENSLVKVTGAINFASATQSNTAKAKVRAKASSTNVEGSNTTTNTSSSNITNVVSTDKDEVYIGEEEPTDANTDLWVDTNAVSGNITGVYIDDNGHLIVSTSDSQGVLYAKINGEFVPVMSNSTENDPVFCGSAAYKITDAMIDVLEHIHYDATNQRVYADKDFYSQGGLSAYGYNGGSAQLNVNVENVLNSGVEIAKVNGVSIYAPECEGGGSNVVWNQLQSSGVKIATIKIDDGSPIDIYSPMGGETNLTAYATKQWVNEQGFLKTYTETDPVFVAHAAHSITDDMIAVLSHLHMSDGKVYVDADFYSEGGLSAYGYNGGSAVSVNVEPKLSSGVEIATINGTSIYAPNGGSNVEWTQIYNSGVNIATIKIGNNDPIEVYAPTSSGTPDLSSYATKQWVNNQGFLKTFTETDPIFSASAASQVTAAMIRMLTEYIVLDDNGRIKVNGSLYATGGVSAYGYNGGSELTVTVDQVVTSGTEIAKINGTSIFAPKSGSNVAWSQKYATSGENIATITIDGTSYDVYAPKPTATPDLSGYATKESLGSYLKKDGTVAMTDYLQIPIGKGVKVSGGGLYDHEGGVQIAGNGLAFWQKDGGGVRTHLSGNDGICLHTGATDAFVEIIGNIGAVSQPGKLKIGEAVLTYDSVNKALKIYSATTGEVVNLYVTGGITAFQTTT